MTLAVRRSVALLALLVFITSQALPAIAAIPDAVKNCCRKDGKMSGDTSGHKCCKRTQRKSGPAWEASPKCGMECCYQSTVAKYRADSSSAPLFADPEFAVAVRLVVAAQYLSASAHFPAFLYQRPPPAA